MKNKVSFAISEKHLLYLIIDLCEVPSEYIIETATEKLTLYIARDREPNDNGLLKAKLQEALRERFSHPAKIEFNQEIINNEH